MKRTTYKEIEITPEGHFRFKRQLPTKFDFIEASCPHGGCCRVSCVKVGDPIWYPEGEFLKGHWCIKLCDNEALLTERIRDHYWGTALVKSGPESDNQAPTSSE